MPSRPNPSEPSTKNVVIYELSTEEALIEVRVPWNSLFCIVLHGDDSIERMYICAKGEDAH